MSGVVWAEAKNQKLRFLTLTTAGKAPRTVKETADDWRAFVKRVRRRYGEFEFLKVVEWTKSGLEHLHILFRGPYIPQEWISSTWEEIHGAKITYVEEVKGTRATIANYLTKYIVKGEERFNWSKNWVYPGFVGDWKAILRKTETVKEAVQVWNAYLFRVANHGRPKDICGKMLDGLWRTERYRVLKQFCVLGIGWQKQQKEEESKSIK